MALPEDSTNLNLVKVGRSGKIKVDGENKKEESAAFKRLMAKMQEEAGPGGYLHGRGALDHDDVLYLKEQQAAEVDAEKMRQYNERKAFLAFRAAQTAASTNPDTVFVEPKPRSTIRQQDLIKSRVEVKPKKPRLHASSDSPATASDQNSAPSTSSPSSDRVADSSSPLVAKEGGGTAAKVSVHRSESNASTGTSGSALLGLAYDDEDDDDEEDKDGRGEGKSDMEGADETTTG